MNYQQLCLECGHTSHLGLIQKLGGICPVCECDLAPLDLDQINALLQDMREAELEETETDPAL